MTGRSPIEDTLRAELARVYRSRRWIAAFDLAQVAANTVGQVRLAAGLDRADRDESGGGEALAVAVRRGMGAIDDDVELLCLEHEAQPDLMTNVTAAEDALGRLPAEVVERIDRWDPERSARAIVTFTGVAGAVAGRATYGARPQAWRDLEDKIVAIDVWRRAGVTAAPMSVVAADDADALVSAHRRLATAEGTVWAVDNARGWHGGGHGTRWVRSEAAATEAARAVAGDHRLVRVMPFLDGLPCSIHGIVFPQRTLALRPCEMITLRNRTSSQLVYCRAAMAWDPGTAAAEEMQHAARRVGDELRRRVGYRGVFTLDGVLTADGFRPTEINPRYGAALPMVIPSSTDGQPDINLVLTNLMIVEGDLEVDPDELEHWLVTKLRENRSARTFVDTERGPDTDRRARVVRTSDGALVAIDTTTDNHGDGDGDTDTDDDDGAAPIATVEWGSPGQQGGVAILSFTNLETGPPVAPLVLDVLRAIDALWSVGAPPLEASAPP